LLYKFRDSDLVVTDSYMGRKLSIDVLCVFRAPASVI
jgi:hypothetical protein